MKQPGNFPPHTQVKLNHLHLDVLKDSEVLQQIDDAVSSRSPWTLCHMNFHHFNYAGENGEYHDLLSRYTLRQPDGIAIRTAARILSGFSVFFNDISHGGTDFYPKLLRLASGRKWKIYFLGDTDPTLSKLRIVLQERYPGIVIAGMHNGFFPIASSSVVDNVRESDADIILVGMGVPRQDHWIMDFNAAYDVPVSISVGAGLGFISGSIRRAPLLFRCLYLEWLWRLILEPKRLWRRYLFGSVLFFLYILRLRIKNK